VAWHTVNFYSRRSMLTAGRGTAKITGRPWCGVTPTCDEKFLNRRCAIMTSDDRPKHQLAHTDTQPRGTLGLTTVANFRTDPNYRESARRSGAAPLCRAAPQLRHGVENGSNGRTDGLMEESTRRITVDNDRRVVAHTGKGSEMMN